MSRSIEYGVFNDEGLIDSGFYSKSDAIAAASRYVSEGDLWASAHPICEYHEDEVATHCEKCNSEES